MKRTLRRTLAAMVGLALGWYAAGLVPSMPGPSPTLASGAGHEHAAAPAAHDGKAPEASTDESGEGHPDAGQAAAHELVPQPEQITWYPGVLGAAAALFAAAVLIGPLAIKLRGPLPPDPADQHGHDAHGHDEHDDKSAHAGHGH